MNNKIIKFSISIFIFSILIAPAFSFAAGLVACDNVPTITTSIVDGKSVSVTTYAKPCDFNAFMDLINTVIKFILFKLAVPISAIMFFYAGFELVISGGNTEKRGMAKKVFTNAVLGLVIAVASWLIVRTVLNILGYQGDWIGF
ncbi:MAG: hypothetical protein WCG28_01935 [bacterium]